MSAPRESQEAQGRAWFPASTGMPCDRPPTRGEMREAWMRQARGVYEMTVAARTPATVAKQGPHLVAALMLLAGAGLVAALVLLPPSAHPGVVIALHVVAGALLLLAQLAGPSVMTADAVAEVTAKSSQAWISSPLATSAWVAGKVAFYLKVQATSMLRFLPVAGASAMLGGLKLREVLAIAFIGLAWTFVAGVGVAAASLEARQSLAARLAARRGVLGARFGQGAAFRGNTPPAAGFAVAQIALGIAGAFMVLPFAFSGMSFASAPPPVALMISAFCVISPIGASASVFFPQMALPVLGYPVPLWLVSITVALAVAPVAVATARLRWRPPDGATGLGVRPAGWLAWTILGALVLCALRESAPAIAVAACLVPVAGCFAALTAGGSRLPDLAAERVTGWRRIAGLDRRTAEWHGLVVTCLLAALVMLIAPAGTFGHAPRVPAMIAIVAATLPSLILAGALGREGRRAMARLEAGVKARTSRPAGIVFAVVVAAAVSPIVGEVFASYGSPAAVAACRIFAILSPISTLLVLAGDVLGLALPGGGQPASTLEMLAVPAGLALQLALALLARHLEHRAASREETPAPPAPSE